MPLFLIGLDLYPLTKRGTAARSAKMRAQLKLLHFCSTGGLRAGRPTAAPTWARP